MVLGSALPPGHRVRLIAIGAIGLGVAVLALRGGPGSRSTAPSASASGLVDQQDPRPETPDTEAAPPLPASCEDLATRAATGGPDAVALGWLCPDTPLNPVAARAFAASLATPTAAATALPRLRDHAGLAAITELVAATAIDVDPATLTSVPRPESASVSPIGDAVLRHTQRARATLYAKGTTHEQRVRGRAYLAKVASQGLQQLGVRPGAPASPLAVQLASMALHHARGTAEAHWRRRVPGLAPVFAQLEDTILSTLLALQSTPYAGDDARTTVERGRARDYALRPGPRGRIDGRAAAGPDGGRPTTDAIWTLADEIPRLAAHGLVDRAVLHVVAAARQPQSAGLATYRRFLTDALVAADRGELVPRVGKRLARLAEAPPAEGPGRIPEAIGGPALSADAAAERAEAWLSAAVDAATHAPSATDTDRNDRFEVDYALLRCLALLQTRPDATARLAERLLDAPPAMLAAARRIIVPQLASHDGRRLSTVRLRVAVDAAIDSAGPAAGSAVGSAVGSTVHEAEAQRRRRFAATLRM